MVEPARIVVALGEVLWDLFPDGARFGGAPANFAHHAASLGADVSLVTGLGDDELGHAALERLRASHVGLDQVAVLADYPTGRVNIELNVNGEATYQFGPDEAWDHLQWSDDLADLASKSDVVCFGTLGQRHEDSRLVIQRLVAATGASCFRVLDLNLRPPFVDVSIINASLGLANVLKLNDTELSFLADHLALSSREELGRMREIAERFELRAVALTLGPRGALLVRHRESCHVTSQPVDVQDTVGAGDSLTAVIALGLAAGAELDEIGQAACRVAEYVCTQKGATPKLPTALLPRFTVS